MEMHSFLSVHHVTQITCVLGHLPRVLGYCRGTAGGATVKQIKAVIHYISFDTNGCYKEYFTSSKFMIDPQPLKLQSVNSVLQVFCS